MNTQLKSLNEIVTELRLEIYNLQQEEHKHEWQYEFTKQQIRELQAEINKKLSLMTQLERIADFVIDMVSIQTTDNQLIVQYHYIESKFSIKIDEDMANKIFEKLQFCEEVLDVIHENNSFDVILGTAYVKGYIQEEED